MRLASLSSIEHLEDRIAPAALYTFTGNSFHYTDQDGDLVTIKFNKNFITSSNVDALFTLAATGTGKDAQLQMIDLDAVTKPSSLSGMNLIATAHKVPGGDGKVNIGYIEAKGINFRAVSIVGDLGRIDAGGSTRSDNAFVTLTVGSLGGQGLVTQASGGTLVSNITEGIGRFHVTGSVLGASVLVSGGITSLTVGGDLSAGSMGATTGAGVIQVNNAIGNVGIVGNLIGGSASGTGEIDSLFASITSVVIGKNIDGTAGTDGSSGCVSAGTSLGNITVHGSVLGGPGSYTGSLRASGAIGKVVIAGDLQGDSSTVSGAIVAGANITSVSVDNVTGGATIRAGHQLGPVVVRGAMTGTSDHPVIISGQGGGSGSTDLGIAGLSVAQNMTYADILAGYSTTLAANDPNAQIGAVAIGGSLVASNIVAGVSGGMNGGNFVFGTPNDTVIDGLIADSSVVSKIASVTIRGSVAGDSVSGASYGITAQNVVSVKIGANAAALHTGASNDTFAAGKQLAIPSTNVTIDEV